MGAGANVYACVYFPTTPAQPVLFNFTPNSDACMNSGGSAASISVAEAGVSAVSVGYVEAKVSGCKCLTAASYWTLGYSAPGTPYSGSVKTQWYTPPEFNSITLESPGTTTVNTVAAKSSNIYQQWHGTGTLYIVFSPVATSALEHLPVLRFFTPKVNQHKIDELYAPLIEPYLLDRTRLFLPDPS